MQCGVEDLFAAQIAETVLGFAVLLVAAIIAGAVTSYIILMRYEGDVPNATKYQFPDENYISPKELEELLTSEGLESERVRSVLEKAEKQSEARSYHEYLGNFLLPHELKVFQVLADALIADGPVHFGSEQLLVGGWRNKNQILVESGVPKKSLYGRSNIVFRFLALRLVRRRKSRSIWGGQKFQYSLNKGNEIVKEYIRILWESRQG